MKYICALYLNFNIELFKQMHSLKAFVFSFVETKMISWLLQNIVF